MFFYSIHIFSTLYFIFRCLYLFTSSISSFYRISSNPYPIILMISSMFLHSLLLLISSPFPSCLQLRTLKFMQGIPLITFTCTVGINWQTSESSRERGYRSWSWQTEAEAGAGTGAGAAVVVGRFKRAGGNWPHHRGQCNHAPCQYFEAVTECVQVCVGTFRGVSLCV